MAIYCSVQFCVFPFCSVLKRLLYLLKQAQCEMTQPGNAPVHWSVLLKSQLIRFNNCTVTYSTALHCTSLNWTALYCTEHFPCFPCQRTHYRECQCQLCSMDRVLSWPCSDHWPQSYTEVINDNCTSHTVYWTICSVLCALRTVQCIFFTADCLL